MPKSIRDIIQQVGHTKTGKFIQQPSISAFTKRLNYAVFDIKALINEGRGIRTMVSYRVEEIIHPDNSKWKMLIYKDNTREQCEWVELSHLKAFLK